MPEIQVQNRSLASGFCPSTYQDILNAFTAQQYITVSDSSGQWQFSSEKPTDNTKAWWKLDQFGRPEQIYRFAQGSWLSIHPLPPGFIMPWFSEEPTFATFDGGDADALSIISGPMWARLRNTSVDVNSPTLGDIDGKFPLAMGTLASGTVIGEGDNGGEEKHILTEAEMPIHDHDLTRPTRAGDTPDGSWEAGNGADLTVQTENAGSGLAHNNMPPYVGMMWLYRTIKKFYRVP